MFIGINIESDYGKANPEGIVKDKYRKHDGEGYA